MTGKATGDYRVESVSLVRARHQPNAHTLVLDVTAVLGPVENPHPEIVRNFGLEFKERPAGGHSKVEIVNRHQHFTIDVT